MPAPISNNLKKGGLIAGKGYTTANDTIKPFPFGYSAPKTYTAPSPVDNQMQTFANQQKANLSPSGQYGLLAGKTNPLSHTVSIGNDGGIKIQSKPTETAPVTPQKTSPTPLAYNANLGLTTPQNAPQGVSQQTTQTVPSFGGLLGRLASSAGENTAIGQTAANIAKEYGQQIADTGLQGVRAQAGYRTTGTSPVGEGNAAIQAQSVAAQQAALAAGEQAALQGTGQQLTAQQQQANALNQAGNLAQPQLAGFNQQAFNPVTGQFTGGSSLQDAVANVVEKLKAGTMSYNDAAAALSGYGQGGINALQQALPQGFNVAQSNTLAGQQGTVGATYQLADTAITNLENAVKNIGGIQSTNIPAINQIGNFLSTQTGVGSQQTREYTQAVQSARNAYAALLASVKGGIPSDYSSQALAEVPDNPTPNDIAALRQSFNVLGQARKDIFGNPGVSGQGTAGGSLYDF